MNLTKLVNAFLIIVMVISTITIINGCGASVTPTVESADDYLKGKVDPGLLVGMSPERMKEFVDGITDSKTRIAALDIWQQNYASLPSNSGFTLGKVIIANSTNREVTIGVEGPMVQSWTLGKKETCRSNLIPGDYFQWYDDGHGKEYKFKDKNKTIYDVKTIGYPVENFHGEPASAVFNYHNRY